MKHLIHMRKHLGSLGFDFHSIKIWPKSIKVYGYIFAFILFVSEIV